jgi:hypothetical protein
MATFTFHIFRDLGQILFGGGTFHDGQVVSYAIGCGQAYGVSATNVQSGVQFWQWSTNTDGQFEYPTASSTTYTSGTRGGIIELVLNNTGYLAYTWVRPGAYIYTGPGITGVTGVSRVQSTFNVPRVSYVPNLFGRNNLAIGVQMGTLGGFTWMTFLHIMARSDGTISYYVVNVGPQLIVNSPGGPIDVGDTFYVTIDTQNGVVATTVRDDSKGWYVAGGASLSTSLDTGSASWQAVVPTAADVNATCLNNPFPSIEDQMKCGPSPAFQTFRVGVVSPYKLDSLIRVVGTGGHATNGPTLFPGYVGPWNDFGSPPGAVTSFPIYYQRMDTTPPTAPGTPGWTAIDQTGPSVTLTWPAASDAESGVMQYDLQHQLTGGTWTSLSSTIVGTSFLDSTLVRGATYFYRARAVDVAGNWGPYSATSSPLTVPYKLSISSGSGGTTSPAPGNYYYSPGSSATVWAMSSNGFAFKSWTLDSLQSTANPLTLAMNGDHGLTASFTNGFNLTIGDSSPRGETNPPGPGTYTYSPGTVVTVGAWPYGACWFNWWYLDGTRVYGDSISVTMDMDHSLSADFGAPTGGTCYL